MKQNYFLQFKSLSKSLLLMLSLTMCSIVMKAQLFYNTGNGSDGAYTASVNTTLAGGTYNFTNFTIDPGVTVTVTGTAPLIIRCMGNADINGVLQANGAAGTDGITYTAGGAGGQGVAGGGDGGNGSFAAGTGPLVGTDGVGAGGIGNMGTAWSGGGGGGYANNGTDAGPGVGLGGPANGNIMVTNLPGGSGGGGGSGGYNCGAGGGGAGGGMIAINAAGAINIGAAGAVVTNGGNGGSDGTGNCGGGGAGSGGTIWLAAPVFTHLGTLSSLGGVGGASAIPGNPYYGVGGFGSEGRIRVDYDGPLVLTGTNLPPIGFHTNIGNIPLPVVLKQFYGNVAGTANRLVWTSVSELNNDHYVLQHSTDGNTFTTIENIASKAISGNSTEAISYETVHTNPAEGHNYYRLKQVDMDGQMSEHSKVIDIIRSTSGNEVAVYPNPVRDELNVSLYIKDAGTISFNLIDMSGRIVWMQEKENAAGLFNHTLQLENLPAGIYSLKITNGAGLNMVSKVRKL